MNSYWALLARKRKALGKSQTEFAAALSYSVQAIAKYEKGQAEMNVSVLLKTARFLEVDPDSLLAGIDAKNNAIADTTEFNEERFLRNWRNARLQKGLSQESLAKAIGMTTRSLKNYERGSSRPSFSSFASYLKAVGVNASSFFSQDFPSSALLPPAKKVFSRPLFLTLVFVIVFGGAGTGVGLFLFRKNPNAISLDPVSSSSLSVPVTSSATSSSTGDSPSSHPFSSTGSTSSNGSSSSGAVSASNGIANNGEAGVAFQDSALASGMESSLQLLNYECGTNAIQPAYAFSQEGSLPSVFFCAAAGFYLPYQQGGGTLYACLYDFKEKKSISAVISRAVTSSSVPADLDRAIADCQTRAQNASDSAMMYQTNEATPAAEAFQTLRDYGSSKGYVIVSGSSYTFTSAASEAYRKDLLAAESKMIGTGAIADSSSKLGTDYATDKTYLTSLKY